MKAHKVVRLWSGKIYTQSGKVVTCGFTCSADKRAAELTKIESGWTRFEYTVNKNSGILYR
jgi:hypothetical protein